MDTSGLGKIYQNGETIIRQGDNGDCMFVIQEGRVSVVKELDSGEVELAVRGPGEFFGEMALFEHETRMATVRAIEKTRILTIDKKSFLRRVHEDPSLAYHLVQALSARIRQLSEEVERLEHLLAQKNS
jgi:CRP/FNR family transcriptional regulator, cyclic AMP receptor protein